MAVKRRFVAEIAQRRPFFADAGRFGKTALIRFPSGAGGREHIISLTAAEDGGSFAVFAGEQHAHERLDVHEVVGQPVDLPLATSYTYMQRKLQVLVSEKHLNTNTYR